MNNSQQHKVFQVRKTAMQIYGAIIEKKISLSGITDENNGVAYYIKLSEQERRLAKAIVIVAVKHRKKLEYLLTQYIKKPLPKGARNLEHLLHISLAQLLYMKAPNYAVINSAVEIAKYDSRTRRFASLVNAILRQIARDSIKKDFDKKLALPPLQSVPQWFADLLVKDYGQEKAIAIILAEAAEHNSLDLTIKQNVEYWGNQLKGLNLWANNIRLPYNAKQDVKDLPGFAEGAWWVQDCAAAIPSLLFSDLSDKIVADLCAAPGGKTAQLALRAKKVVAFEINVNRMQRLKANMHRLQLNNISYNLGDFTKMKPVEQFDAILLDAPCSSTGTLRKNPDILWNKDKNAIIELANIQYNMLLKAIDLLKIGGELVFSNCSLFFIEGEDVIAKLLAVDKRVKLAENIALIDNIDKNFEPFIKNHAYLRVTPADFSKLYGKAFDQQNYSAAMDGFFIAKLIKIA